MRTAILTVAAAILLGLCALSTIPMADANPCIRNPAMCQ